MHIISVNMSALPHYQVADKQEWSDNTNYIILQFATLPTCNCFWENFSSFNIKYRYVRQRYKKCMLWRFIAWYIQNSTRHPLWDSATVRQQASKISMWCCSKNTCMFVILCHLEVRIYLHVDIHEQNVTFCASLQLLFLLTNEVTCRQISVQYF
jgi:hypothetical protein